MFPAVVLLFAEAPTVPPFVWVPAGVAVDEAPAVLPLAWAPAVPAAPNVLVDEGKPVLFEDAAGVFFAVFRDFAGSASFAAGAWGSAGAGSG